jgi:hypothetical protein
MFGAGVGVSAGAALAKGNVKNIVSVVVNFVRSFLKPAFLSVLFE